MFRLVSATTTITMLATAVAANPWEVREGSTLLDGTKTATYVAGHMFSGKEYEYTSAQINLRCIDGELVMSVVGDSGLLTKAEAETNPTIDLMIKSGDDLASFKSTVDAENWLRDRARIQDAPGLLEYLRQHDGGSAQVQIPVANTGVPEVRTLSLENVVAASDLALSTCGPLQRWEPAAAEGVAEESAVSDQPPTNLETEISVGIAKKAVEEIIRSKGVAFEQVMEVLKPLLEEE